MTSAHYHRIIDYLRRIIDATQWENHVFTVGGCCRDEILGHEIKDVDLAVDLPGGGIGFAQWLYEKGLAVKDPVTFPSFGTAMLRLSEFPDDEIEIVQTRAEKYTDSTRRDPTVVFGPIEADCRRRDLTINALYYDISRGCLLDILGCSVDDIHNRIIRTPDAPDATFDDDPVRILRAVRLSARYGWEIDPATFEAMRRNAERLKIIRPERMRQEFDKMLVGPNPARAMDLLRLCGALPYIMPELVPLIGLQQSKVHGGDVWEFTLNVLDKVPADSVLRLAALLHDVAKPVCRHIGSRGAVRFSGHERRSKPLINTAMRRMHYDRDVVDKVIFLVVNHNVTKTWGPQAAGMTDCQLRRLQYKCVTTLRFDRLMALIEADNLSYDPPMPEQVPAIRRRSDELRRNGEALFTFRRQLTVQQIRRLKNLPKNADLQPFVDFLLSLAIENPHMPQRSVIERLKHFNPKSTR